MNNAFLAHCINTAHAANSLRQFEVAIWWSRKALEIFGRSPEAWFNLGVALAGKNQRREALEALVQANSLTQHSSQAQNSIGFVLLEIGSDAMAEDCFRNSIALTPSDPFPCVNLGRLRAKQRRLDDAIDLFRRAIELQPNLVAGHVNYGAVLLELKKLQEAEAACRKAIELSPESHEAWSNLGLVLMESKNPESISCFRKSLELKPNAEYLLGYLLHAKQRFCEWQDMTTMLLRLEQQIGLGQRVSLPFPLLALTGLAEVQFQAARLYVDAECPGSDALGAVGQSRRSDSRVKVAYFSADFRDHPVSQIMVKIFELHDRSRFEIIGFSLCPGDSGELRERIAKSFDRFLDVSGCSDIEVASLARQMGVDIAVDLGGHTADARMGIFSYRVAPVQAGYVGYLGTSGASYFDYLLADEQLIPEESRSFYSEKIAYLPTFQPPDSGGDVTAAGASSREQLGLPSTAFVFACLNNNFKITPSVFDVWARLLVSIEGSVLLLLADNPIVVDNLRAEAKSRGVDPSRLVFSGRMPRAQHLARYQVADLFLDTLPCNAGTTATEALSAGLPVLTCLGQTFAGRIAASQLWALGVPELIAKDLREYEARALELAMQPEMLLALKEKLLRNKASSPLLEPTKFVRSLEDVYLRMHDRGLRGLPPDHLCLR